MKPAFRVVLGVVAGLVALGALADHVRVVPVTASLVFGNPRGDA